MRSAEEKKTRRENLQSQYRSDFSRNQLLWGSAVDHGHARNYITLNQILWHFSQKMRNRALYIYISRAQYSIKSLLIKNYYSSMLCPTHECGHSRITARYNGHRVAESEPRATPFPIWWKPISHESLILAVISGCPSAGRGGLSALRVGSFHLQAIAKVTAGFIFVEQQKGSQKAGSNHKWENELQIQI